MTAVRDGCHCSRVETAAPDGGRDCKLSESGVSPANAKETASVVMNGQMMDVHGAGAQRSDRKSGDPSTLPVGAGPQGDVQSIYNYVRCVRSGSANASTNTGAPTAQPQSGQQPAGQTQPTGQAGGVQGQQGQQPPQEAIAACSGLSVGSACSINTPNGTVSGTCGTPPNSTLVACMPAGGPPP